MYRVLADFADMQDGGYIYHAGDTYPRDGVEVSEKRVAILKSHSNRLGTPLIETAHKTIGKQENGEKKPNNPRRRAKKEG